MAMILDIADALVTALNAEEFSLDFTAVRTYAPNFDLSNTSGLYVPVVAKGIASVLTNRANDSDDTDRVDVGVLKKVDNALAVTLDPLMGLVEEVGDFCKGLHMGTTPEAVCISIENEPIFIPDMLREKQTFASILTLTFKTWR